MEMEMKAEGVYNLSPTLTRSSHGEPHLVERCGNLQLQQSQLALVGRVTDQTVANKAGACGRLSVGIQMMDWLTDGEEEDGNESRDDVAADVGTVVREGDTAAVLEVFIAAPAHHRS